MRSHEEMIAFQASSHGLIQTSDFRSREEYVLHLVHTKPYAVAARLAAGRRALDLGCNNGHGTALLRRTAASVLGVDVSSDAIAAAKHAHPQVDFRVVDGSLLPFPDGSFDVVVSFQVIEHVVAYDAYLGEIKRVLAPGGVALFTTPNARLRLDPGMKPWNEFHVREFAAEELAALLSQHFGHTGVQGLFADDPLHAIERDRVTRARRCASDLASRAHAPARNALVKALIPEKLRAAAAAAWGLITRRRPSPKPSAPSEPFASDLDPSFMRAHGIDQLHYRSTDLDAALDLLALCSDDARALESASSNLL